MEDGAPANEPQPNRSDNSGRGLESLADEGYEKLVLRLELEYQSASLSEIDQAIERVKEILRKHRRSAEAELLELGFYEAIPYQYGSDGSRLAFGDTEEYRAMCLGHTMRDVPMARWFDIPEAGEWKCMVIPRDTYPALYELDTKHRWLAALQLERGRSDPIIAAAEVRRIFLLD